MTLTPAEIQSLASRVEAGIGSEDEDECRDAAEALIELADEAEESGAVAEALRDAIYDASKL